MKIELIQGSILDEKIITTYFETVDNKFGGNLTALVHNASQIYIPEGDSRAPYEIGQPQNSNYGNLLQTRSDAKGKGSKLTCTFLLKNKFFIYYLTFELKRLCCCRRICGFNIG